MKHELTDADYQDWLATVRATFTVDCIVITSSNYKRADLIDTQILPELQKCGFDEILVVGEHHDGEGYRYLHVPPLTHTTTDALVKRDVGALASTADVLVYLSDDHYFRIGSMGWLAPDDFEWDVIVPKRVTYREGAVIPLNNGERENYCGGHSMVVKRWVVQRVPWSTMPHHPNWDFLGSRIQQSVGAKFRSFAGVECVDVEPGVTPWL